jgi:hypothetical protein
MTSSHQLKLSIIRGTPLSAPFQHPSSAPASDLNYNPEKPGLSFFTQIHSYLWECIPVSVNICFACYFCVFCPNLCSIHQEPGTLTSEKCQDPHGWYQKHCVQCQWKEVCADWEGRKFRGQCRWSAPSSVWPQVASVCTWSLLHSKIVSFHFFLSNYFKLKSGPSHK